MRIEQPKKSKKQLLPGSAGRSHGKFRFSGLSRSRGRNKRPQATAGDRRRPQATSGDRRRASASAAKKNEPARLHGTKTPPRLIPAPCYFAHERAAEMGGGDWRPSQGGSVQRRANDRGNGDIPFHATRSHGPDAIQ